MTLNHRLAARSAWTDERIDLLKSLHAEGGLSAAFIAARLGGVTRNAVIGKLARLGLTSKGRRPRVTTPNVPRIPRKRKSSFLFGLPGSMEAIDGAPLPPRHETDIPRVAFLDLEPKHCRFIPGDPLGVGLTDPQFCGLDKVAGLAYCRAHAGRCFDTLEARRALAAQGAAVSRPSIPAEAI